METVRLDQKPQAVGAALSPSRWLTLVRRVTGPIWLRIGFVAVLTVPGGRTGAPVQVTHFAGLGARGFSMLGWSFLAVCALDALAGIWLWEWRRRGARLGMATNPLALIPWGWLCPAVPPRRRPDTPRPDLGRAREPAMSLGTAIQGELDEK